MTRAFAFILAVAVALPVAVAQQPNDPALGSLVINNQPGGGVYPINNIPVFGGTTAQMEIRGGANVQFAVINAPRLVFPPGLPFLGGIVDLDLSEPNRVVFYLDGFFGNTALYHCNESGRFLHFIPIPSNIAAGLTAAYQGIVQEPASPFGIVLTAATSINTSPGVQTVTINGLADDNCIFVNTLQSYGFNIKFYAQNWNGCWVCANGFINFGGSNTDFTPTDAKMHTQQPRIAPYWSDLDLTVGGTGPVTLRVDQTTPNPIMTFHFNNVADWPTGVNGGLGYHTFGVIIEPLIGDVVIQQFPDNQNSNYDIVIGMSAGNGLDPTGAGSMNLSSRLAQGPYQALPNEGMYEGFRGVTSITGAFPAAQIYDLANYYWKYTAVGAGSPGAFYVMDLTNPPAGF